MSGFLLRIILNSVVWVTGLLHLPGIFVDTLGSTLLGAAIIGIANAAIRPVMLVVTLPLTVLTLGGVTLVTNVVAPLMVVQALPGFVFSCMLTPWVAIVALTACSCMLTRVIHDR